MTRRLSLRFVIGVAFTLVTALPASAQLIAAKDGPIVYGHHHLEHEQRRGAEEVLRQTRLAAQAITIGTNKLEIIQFPNVLIFFRQAGANRRHARARRSTTSGSPCRTFARSSTRSRPNGTRSSPAPRWRRTRR